VVAVALYRAESGNVFKNAKDFFTRFFLSAQGVVKLLT